MMEKYGEEKDPFDVVLKVSSGEEVVVDDELERLLSDEDYVDSLLFHRFAGKRIYSAFALPFVFMGSYYLSSSFTFSVLSAVVGLFAYLGYVGGAISEADSRSKLFFLYRDTYLKRRE